MISNEKSIHDVFLLTENGESVKLKRVPFTSKESASSFDELWLQQLIEKHPEIIPTSQLGGDYTPLICIGREVAVGSGENTGYIDNLYITPSGMIVIVETKLFRNQEARRTVIAQIIDYAKEVQKWDAEKLDKIAQVYFDNSFGREANITIFEHLKEKNLVSEEDEADFYDNINSNLSKANFLLMIVGDGIRTGIQEISDFLKSNANMAFNLALAEVEVYEDGDRRVIVPHITSRTDVIERNIFSPEPVIISEASEKHSKPILSRRELISRFADNGGYDADEVTGLVGDLEIINGIYISMAPTELQFRFSLPNGKSYTLLGLSIWNEQADFYFIPSRVINDFERFGLSSAPAKDFCKSLIPILKDQRNREPFFQSNRSYYINVSLALQDRDKLIEQVEKFVLDCHELAEKEKRD